LTHPKRVPDPSLRTFNPATSPSLNFETIDEERFPVFSLGVDSGRKGGTGPTIFNAANEIAVAAFVNGQIEFIEIPLIIEETINSIKTHGITTINDVVEADESARHKAKEVVFLL